MRASSACSNSRQGRPSGLRRAIVWGRWGVEFGERGADDPGVGLGEEDGEAPPVGRERVALGAGLALDQVFAAQVVGHLPGAVAGDQLGDASAQRAVGESLQQVAEGAQ
jgi:hypothetical protein